MNFFYTLQNIKLFICSIFLGETCSILTYEQTVLKASFYGWQPDGSEILVRDMTTPANTVIPSALLRLPDVLAIQFEKPIQLP